jgi:hypothetical protein
LLASSRLVRFRWRVIPDASGATGTFRVDDIAITLQRTLDLELTGLRIVPPRPIEQESITAVALVRNAGQVELRDYAVNFFVDVNNDSLPQLSELVASGRSTASLQPGDSTEISGTVGAFVAGSRLLIGVAALAADENPANDRVLLGLNVGYRERSVVVNEVMYAPTGSEPEWIELYNTRTDSINVKDWTVSDNTATRRTISNRNLSIPSGSYIVLTRDSAALLDVHPSVPVRVVNISDMPTFNNTGDAVAVLDNRGAKMDSVSYLPSWGGSSGGKSLERKDPLLGSTLQSNWGTSKHSSGSTPGQRNSLAKKDFDLKLDTIFVAPSAPFIRDSLHVSCLIRNAGRLVAQSYNLLLYEDADGDSIAETGELLFTANSANPLQSQDSLTIAFGLQRNRAGLLRLLARVGYADDEDTTNNSSLTSVIVGFRPGTLLINEIMYAPPPGMPEWVELLNASRDTVDLKDWRLGNRSPSPRYVITSTPLVIAPDSFLVVTKDTALLHHAFPLNINCMIQSASLPTFLWNNSGDAVVLSDNRRLIIDSVVYAPTWGGASGTSLERIDPLGVGNDSTNWASSQDTMLATPGRRNSILLLDDDLRAVRGIGPSVSPGSAARINITVANAGRRTSGQFDVFLFDDQNLDSVATTGELVAQASFTQPINPRDSLVATLVWQAPSAGVHNLIARIVYAQDLRPGNNSVIFPLKVGYGERSLLINEIMYSPLPRQAEYVEIVNPGRADVDLFQWKLNDRPTTSGSVNTFTLSSAHRVMHPGEYFVMGSDSTIFTLFPYLKTTDSRLFRIVNSADLSFNSDGDDLVLRDPTGACVDSVPYRPSWHRAGVADYTGRALERISPSLNSNDPRSWSTCANGLGGTPGLANSIYASSLPTRSLLSVSPNPFSPDGDGHEDFTLVHYEVPLEVSTLRIRIYDVRGRLIRTLVTNEPTGATGTAVWDGLDDGKQKARIGMYVVLLEAINDLGGIIETAKAVVVLAGRL